MDEMQKISHHRWQRTWKAAEFARIQQDASLSVTAGVPYLSHLAMRKDLQSLHHVLKGTKTLSTARYEPRLTDTFIIDFADMATFTALGGYYHGTIRTRAGTILPSSDELLHALLQKGEWDITRVNELAVFRKGEPARAGGQLAIATGSNGPLAEGVRWHWLSPSVLQLEWNCQSPPSDLPIHWKGFVLRSTDRAELVAMGPLGLGLRPGKHTETAQIRIPDERLKEKGSGAWLVYLPLYDRTEGPAQLDWRRVGMYIPIN
jgi:hypothetical protein